MLPMTVMAGLDPAIYASEPDAGGGAPAWIPGSSPGMTVFSCT